MTEFRWWFWNWEFSWVTSVIHRLREKSEEHNVSGEHLFHHIRSQMRKLNKHSGLIPKQLCYLMIYFYNSPLNNVIFCKKGNVHKMITSPLIVERDIQNGTWQLSLCLEQSHISLGLSFLFSKFRKYSILLYERWRLNWSVLVIQLSQSLAQSTPPINVGLLFSVLTSNIR